MDQLPKASSHPGKVIPVQAGCQIIHPPHPRPCPTGKPVQLQNAVGNLPIQMVGDQAELWWMVPSRPQACPGTQVLKEFPSRRRQTPHNATTF